MNVRNERNEKYSGKKKAARVTGRPFFKSHTATGCKLVLHLPHYHAAALVEDHHQLITVNMCFMAAQCAPTQLISQMNFVIASGEY